MRQSLTIDIAEIERQLTDPAKQARDDFSQWKLKATVARKIKSEQLLEINKRLNDLGATASLPTSATANPAHLLKEAENIFTDLLDRELHIPKDINGRIKEFLNNLEDLFFKKG
jgi:hypothetical protein